MDLFKSFSKLSSRQRLIILVAIGAILTMISLFADMSYNNQITSVQTQAFSYPTATSAVTNQPMMPAQEQSTITRDPFSLPLDLINSNVSNDLSKTPYNSNISRSPNSVSTKASLPKSSNENYRLTGIAGSSSTRLAVISSGTTSKAYQINEKIGSYKISTISEDSVTLTGPSGQRTLRLETASPKGGEKNSK